MEAIMGGGNCEINIPIFEEVDDSGSDSGGESD